MELITFLDRDYPGCLKARYGEELESGTPIQVLEQIARIRACLKKGGEYDYGRAANLVLDDFRSGKLGKITLELPPQ